MNDEICVHCKFFEFFGDSDDRGFCHRYPRTPVGDDDALPQVRAYDWCGEWKTREEEK